MVTGTFTETRSLTLEHNNLFVHNEHGTSKCVRHYLLFSSSSSSRTLSKALLRSTATGLVLRDLTGDRVRLRRFDRLGVGVRLLCLAKRVGVVRGHEALLLLKRSNIDFRPSSSNLQGPWNIIIQVCPCPSQISNNPPEVGELLYSVQSSGIRPRHPN